MTSTKKVKKLPWSVYMNLHSICLDSIIILDSMTPPTPSQMTVSRFDVRNLPKITQIQSHGTSSKLSLKGSKDVLVIHIKNYLNIQILDIINWPFSYTATVCQYSINHIYLSEAISYP